MDKTAQTRYPIHPLLSQRWSPRAFSPRPVAPETLLALFEAARWAPSGNNLQPWSFLVTTPANPQAHASLLETLGERNRLWAQHAPALALGIAQTEREPGKPNGYALYDLGQAVAHLSVQASAAGLYVHQMGGFDKQKAREVFSLPENVEAVIVLAIGELGDPGTLPDEMRERELAARTRKPLAQMVFDGAWGVELQE